MYGKSNMETYITMCEIDTSGNFLHGSENSNRLRVNLEGQEMGGRFKREGIYVYLWLFHAEV